MTRGPRAGRPATRRPADPPSGDRARGPLAALAGAAALLAVAGVAAAPLAAAVADAPGTARGETSSPRASPVRPAPLSAPRETPSASGAAPEKETPPPSAADSSDLDARTARLADQLRCPVCRSQSVLESSSRLAREMKAEIRRRLAEGQTPEQVKAYFVSRYGEWILLRPEAEGLNLMVYVLPPLLLVGGGLLVWALLRRWSPRTRDTSETVGSEVADRPLQPGAGPAATDATASADEALSPEEERRIEEALREDAGP